MRSLYLKLGIVCLFIATGVIGYFLIQRQFWYPILPPRKDLSKDFIVEKHYIINRQWVVLGDVFVGPDLYVTLTTGQPIRVWVNNHEYRAELKGQNTFQLKLDKLAASTVLIKVADDSLDEETYLIYSSIDERKANSK
jgi:hypothetical protein